MHDFAWALSPGQKCLRGAADKNRHNDESGQISVNETMHLAFVDKHILLFLFRTWKNRKEKIHHKTTIAKSCYRSNQNSIPLKNKTIYGITKPVSSTVPGKSDACGSVVGAKT